MIDRRGSVRSGKGRVILNNCKAIFERQIDASVTWVKKGVLKHSSKYS